MDNIPKKQQEYFNRLKEALSTGDEQMFTDLVRQKNPLAIREDLVNVLGQHTLENYDEPLNVFKDKEILKNTPIEYTKLPKGIAGRYEDSNGGLLLPKNDKSSAIKKAGVLVHEYGHKDDALKGFKDIEEFDPQYAKKLGAEVADEAFSKHHKRGFFEKEALMDLLKNKKLGMLAPLLKATGIGALGVAASGIGNKAMAGDYKGALSDAGELAYDVAAPPILEPPTVMGNAELPPEEEAAKERFNRLRKKLGE